MATKEIEMSGETELLEEVVLEAVLVDQYKIILYNDDVNSFDHVIDSLVEICSHTPIQAEQVAWIVHTKGKCDVKRGEMEKLEPICTALTDRGLSAKIED